MFVLLMYEIYEICEINQAQYGDVRSWDHKVINILFCIMKWILERDAI